MTLRHPMRNHDGTEITIDVAVITIDAFPGIAPKARTR